MAGIDGIKDIQNANAISNVGKKPDGDMGKDDFLKLLVGQLKNQDPMNPMEDKDFMGQMAQFSQLEQTTNMSASMESQKAFSLIGKDVTYTDPKTGEVAAGTVSKVGIEAGKATLTVGDVSKIEISQISEVR